MCVGTFFFFGLRSASGIGGPRPAKTKRLQHFWGTLAGVCFLAVPWMDLVESLVSVGGNWTPRVLWGEDGGEEPHILCGNARVYYPSYLP